MKINAFGRILRLLRRFAPRNDNEYVTANEAKQSYFVRSSKNKAFTLVELLVVMTIMALLMGLLMPALGVARSQGKAVVCKSNLRQLLLANAGYAVDNDGYFVLAASDIWSANTHRWHGVRTDYGSPFDWHKSPLAPYIGSGQVKECSQKIDFRKGDLWEYNYEDGCGGYGYNMTYIGSRIWEQNTPENCEKPVKNTEVRSAYETIMFADCAMAQAQGGGAYYQEYSFAEAPLNDWGYAWPSIHFRHRGKANIGWADGHISSEVMNDFSIVIYDGINSSDVMLGWFGPLDNRFFDLK
ncbi:MAG: type II secretion system protein [Phycisphaerae bacterium]|nr:type II secretion system protein [Phycisphaerae bacterium]